MWHGFGPPEQIAHKMEGLREHCTDVGRDPREIEIICGFDPGLCLRDSEREVEARRAEVGKRINAKVTAPPLNAVTQNRAHSKPRRRARQPSSHSAPKRTIELQPTSAQPNSQ